MSTTHFLLLYDENCPLCQWYSKKFVQTGLLDPKGRVPYQAAAHNTELTFNRDMARNQIALLDTEKGKVLYGIDSLLEIIGQRYASVRTIGHIPVVHRILELLYAFISYNRKVIAPAACNGTCDCKPDKSWFWRTMFIVICGLITFGCTVSFFQNANPTFSHDYFLTDFALFWIQIPLQFIVFRQLKQSDFYTYAGQLAFVSMCNSVLLFLAGKCVTLLAITGVELPFLHLFIYLFCGILFFMHHTKRSEELGFSDTLSLSLIFFRVFFVPFTFQLTVI